MREYDFTKVPIVDIVNEIIVDGAIKNASDIHFDPNEKYLKIRMRIDGDLRDYTIVENKYKRNLTTRIKLLAGMNITESRLPQDGAIKTNINGKDLDLRVACLPTSFGEKIVIRILDYTRSFEGIDALGFTKENYARIESMLNNPNGIILVTGATGSGKSTTVYSMLQRLNKEDTNIITVEDPVEMNIEGINQVQVNAEIGLDFAAVLRSILREDPNVILIGEIRDSETAKIAVRASITGHLVLSTLHTNNSLTTIERLLDMDVERYLLSTSLKGIISQTLAKRMCQKCKKQRATTDAEKKIFKKVLGKDVNYIYEPGGCPDCRNGYKGRIALQEVLLLNDEIRDAINDDINRSELRDMIYKKGAKTLFQDGLLKVIDGITTMEEVFRLVDVDDDFDNVYGKDEEDYEQLVEDNNEEKNDDILNNDENDTNTELDNTQEDQNLTNSLNEDDETIDDILNDDENDINTEVDDTQEDQSLANSSNEDDETVHDENDESFDDNNIAPEFDDNEEHEIDLLDTIDLTKLLNEVNDLNLENSDEQTDEISNNVDDVDNNITSDYDDNEEHRSDWFNTMELANLLNNVNNDESDEKLNDNILYKNKVSSTFYNKKEHRSDWFNTMELANLLNETSDDNFIEKENFKINANNDKETDTENSSTSTDETEFLNNNLDKINFNKDDNIKDILTEKTEIHSEIDNTIQEPIIKQKKEEENSSTYTDDLINLINQGFFE